MVHGPGDGGEVISLAAFYSIITFICEKDRGCLWSFCFSLELLGLILRVSLHHLLLHIHMHTYRDYDPLTGRGGEADTSHHFRGGEES